MKAIFFPANKLNATVCQIYNGHVAVVCQNTDRLRDNQFEKAEIELFRSDIQGTSFLNPRGHLIGENSNYKDLLTRVGGTNRISFGIYYNTNAWISPITGEYQAIPDYEATTWTSAGAAVFATAVVGQPKANRFPNHGMQMYQASNGAYGYNTTTGQIGTSNLSETKNWTAWQVNTLKDLCGKRLSTISYMNGAYIGFPVYTPDFLFARNSVTSVAGDPPTNVTYGGTRMDFMNKASNTRCWDSGGGGSGDATTWGTQIAYARQQVVSAISNNGFYSDFTHWHSVYTTNTLDYFRQYYEGIRAEIGSSDVWLAGVNEAAEYYFIRESIRSVGSFQDAGSIFVFYEVFDKWKGTITNQVDQKINCALLETPLSIRIDLTGTSLAGKNIKCSQAKSIRSLGSNMYILNLPYFIPEEGFAAFKVEESITADYYSGARPTITVSGSNITTDVPSKLVIWRKLTTDQDSNIREVYRNNSLATSFTHPFESGYRYYIGAITKYNHSSLIEI